jgi:PAS domain S-box-containing protein
VNTASTHRTARPQPAAATRSVAGEMRLVGARALTGTWLVLGAVVVAAALAELQWGGAPQVSIDRLIAGCALLATALPAAWLHKRWPGATLAWLLVSLLVALGWLAWRTALGVHMPALAAGALAVALAGPTLGARAAVALAALHLAVVGLLGWAEMRGALDGSATSAAMAMPTRLVGHALLVVGALLAALLLARMVRTAFTRAESERERVTELLQLGSDWTWELDAKGRVVALSPSFEQRTGWRRADFMRVNEPGQPRVVADDRWRAMQQVLRERREFRDQPLTYIGPDGAPMHTVFSGAPMFDAAGQHSGWRGVGRNVTAETQAQREKERTEVLLNRLFETSPDAIAVGRASDGRILLANAGFLIFTGLPHAQVVGRTIGELPLWPDLEEPRRVFRAMRAGGGTVRELRTTVRGADGLPRDVLVTAGGFVTEGETMAVVTLRDITEVERAKQQAEAASRAKSAFLATMSHEIRTPLNGVLGLARLLREPGLGEERRREYLAHLADSAQLLSGLVSDVLDLSKIEAGHLQLEQIDFDLHEVLHGAFAAFAALGQERGLAMSCQLEAGLPRHACGDPVRVRQIVANYLNNALKFTERGTVTLHAAPRPGQRVRVSVRDSGPGVSHELQARLFEPFLQADNSTTRRFGGTGLGLSICRQLARLMGGEVGVQSDGTNGSLFWAELPLAPAAGAAAAATAARCAGSRGDAAHAGGTGDSAPAGRMPGDEPSPLAGLKVLVAEDNAVNMLIVVAMLQQQGAVALEAADGEAALEAALARHAELDAVLMDLHMPGRDGLAVTRALRAEPATARLPVFAFSAAVLEHDRRAAQAAGMNGFIAKPAELKDLLRVLGPLAARRRAAAALAR